MQSMKTSSEASKPVLHTATRHIATWRQIPRVSGEVFRQTFAYVQNRGDAIEVYKYLHGSYTTGCMSMLPLRKADGMTTKMKFKKQELKGQLLKIELPSIESSAHVEQLARGLVTVQSVICFKENLDRCCYNTKFEI